MGPRRIVFAAIAPALLLQVAGGAAQAPAESIARPALEQHVRYLAADERLGRATGTPGALESAQYLAAALAEAGVPPAGEDGSYFQAVPVRRLVYDAAPRVTVHLGDGSQSELVHGIDFQAVIGALPRGELALRAVRSEGDVPAEGVAELALFVDALPSESSAWLAGRSPALVIQAGSERPGREARDAPNDQHWIEGDERPPPALTVRGLALELLRAGDVERVSLEPESRVEALEAVNVLARLPGSGSAAREVVVFSAHYDHIGAKAAAGATEAGAELDLIHNGADDDASGCAAVLELARAFAAGPAPERTLVFLFATGEELGLLGTRHYLRHPCEPLEVTVANLNFEMIGRPDELAGGSGGLWLTGDERTNLGQAWRELGLAIIPDPRPEQHFFERSDNYAFAQLGIVAQSLSSYNLHQDYHGPDDEAERLDFEHLGRAVESAWRAARTLADGSLDPRWNPGGDPRRE